LAVDSVDADADIDVGAVGGDEEGMRMRMLMQM